jgi:hypothetical protein
VFSDSPSGDESTALAIVPIDGPEIDGMSSAAQVGCRDLACEPP